MGVQQSKEEFLYQQVSHGNIEGIKDLHRQGARLEWVDKEGKTPLILASLNSDSLPVAKVLIELGANVNAYRPGLHAGTPLHHAAKKGLEQTVLLLLANGANALKINDACQTPLDIARAKGHCKVVRAIEKHVSVFSGCLRELYGPRILGVLMPQLLSRKIWAVIVPREHHNTTKPSKFELATYPDLQVAQPRNTIRLWTAKIEKLDINQLEPVVVIFDKHSKARYKFLSANEGDRQQLLSFYHACTGMPQNQVFPALPENTPMPNHVSAVPNPYVWATPAIAPAVPNPYVWATPAPAPATPAPAPAVPNPFAWATPATAPAVPYPYVWATPATDPAVPEPHTTATSAAVPNPYISAKPATAASEDAELAMAISASIQSAIAEGLPPFFAPLPVNTTSNTPDQDKAEKTGQSSCCPTYQASSSTGPSSGCSEKQSIGQHVAELDTTYQEQIVAPVILSPAHNPSAPPVMEAIFSNDAVHYPTIDLTNPHNGVKSGKDAEKESGDTTGTCVICLDAAVEGACVPCGHMAGCMSCLSEIKAKGWGCPVCRTKIDQVIKLFAV